MHLKSLRTRLGITQQALAEKLSTSQQTIARWETGQNPIPTKYLKDLAVFLGCSIPELLGVDSKGRFQSEKKRKEGEYDNDWLYGTLTLSFGTKENDVLCWPISQGQRMSVRDQMGDRSGFGHEQGSQSWINFETLDDRIVFVNPRALESISLVGDAAEAAPSYEHQEVYQAIEGLLFEERPTEQELEQDDAPYSKELLEKCEAWINACGGEYKADERMNMLLIERLNGSQQYLPIETDNTGVGEIAVALLDNQDIDPSNLFANLGSEGYNKESFFRFGSLRLIEMSKMKWQEMLKSDDDTPLLAAR